MKNTTLKFLVNFLIVIVAFTYMSWTPVLLEKTPRTSKINTLTRAEKKAGWRLLFDGKTFNFWRGLGRDHVPYGQWVIEDGSIKKANTGNMKILPDGRPVEGGDLATTETFENFELYFEWKLLKAGNSGVKYNVSEEMSAAYGSKYSALGFEYQLLDDEDPMYHGSPYNLQPMHFTGALSDILPVSNSTLKPVGEFNSSRIIVDGNHVEHWLNGKKVLEFEFGSKELDEAFKVSKFNKIQDFHNKRKGHIVLQNHKDEVWFRNIKIRELKK